MKKPTGIRWEKLRKKLLTLEEITESDARIRVIEGFRQIKEGKTKDFNEVCERLEDKYANEDVYIFHKVKSVSTLPNYKLSVQFEDGITKVYDVLLMFDKSPAFRCFITDPELFVEVEVDKGGYGVVWNDELDISCNELYDNGVNMSVKFERIEIEMKLEEADSIKRR